MTNLQLNGTGYRSRPSCRRPVPLFSLPTLDKQPTGEKACPTNLFCDKTTKIFCDMRKPRCDKNNEGNKIAQKQRQLPVQKLRDYGMPKSMQKSRLHKSVNCLCKRCSKISRRQPSTNVMKQESTNVENLRTYQRPALIWPIKLVLKNLVLKNHDLKNQ